MTGKGANYIKLYKNKPVRKSYGFGGSGWIRTTEAKRNRFTVCPLWPLGNSPISHINNFAAVRYVTAELTRISI